MTFVDYCTIYVTDADGGTHGFPFTHKKEKCFYRRINSYFSQQLIPEPKPFWKIFIFVTRHGKASPVSWVVRKRKRGVGRGGGGGGKGMGYRKCYDTKNEEFSNTLMDCA